MIRTLALAAFVVAAPAFAQDAKPVLTDPAVLAEMGREAARLPLLASDLARTRAQLDASIRDGVNEFDAFTRVRMNQ